MNADTQNNRSSRIAARGFLLMALALTALWLVGCTSNPDYIAQVTAYERVETARATAHAERYRALARIADGGDEVTRQKALQAWKDVAIVDSLKGGASGDRATVPAAPPSWADRTFGLVTALAPVAANVWQGYYSTRGAMRASDNATAATIATVAGFRDLGAAGINGTRDTAFAGFGAMRDLGATALARPTYQISAGSESVFAIGGNATRTTTNNTDCTAAAGSGGNAGNGGSSTGSTGTTAAAAAPGGAGGTSGAGGSASVNCTTGR
jgi:hypothetical protein